MLKPKKTKFKKQQKGNNKGSLGKYNNISFGKFGLQSLNYCRITSEQIEAARRAISSFIHREGKIWIRIFPDKPVTKKPIEVRQGKGKGDIASWVALVYPGKIMFELDGVSEKISRLALKLATSKLPVKTKFCKYYIL